MANKKYKLSEDYWATDGVYDFGQSKTQRQINSDLNGALNQLPYYQNDHSSVDCAPLVYTTIAQISITAGTWIIIGSHDFGSAFTENYQDYVDDGNGIQIAIARNLNGSGGGGAAICGFYVASTDTTINYKTFHFHTDGNLSARRIKIAAIKIHN